MKTFWMRFEGLLNLRKVTFSEKKIEVSIAWQGGDEFDESEYYREAQTTLLHSTKPNPQVANGKITITRDFELIPQNQRIAEAVVRALGWNIQPLHDFELILAESGKL